MYNTFSYPLLPCFCYFSLLNSFYIVFGLKTSVKWRRFKMHTKWGTGAQDKVHRCQKCSRNVPIFGFSILVKHLDVSPSKYSAPLYRREAFLNILTSSTNREHHDWSRSCGTLFTCLRKKNGTWYPFAELTTYSCMCIYDRTPWKPCFALIAGDGS